jgi:4-amino-4-deoxy-L-arabinose transferase-like glycosyltransferase
MKPGEIADPLANSRRGLWVDCLAALTLFAATAAVVIWQNSRLGVLWDLSYVLDSSYRISLGDLPYRDFPFPHAPLTFLIQAAIIKLAGRVFWHATAYCALMGGLASVMTWRILLNAVRDKLAHARLVAFLLSLPLVVLGIYCIFPHPFYDPDCTFAILLSVLLLQQLDRRPASLWRAFLAGASLVVPLFVKQNTGLAFFVSAGLALAALMAIEILRKHSVRRYVFALAGAIAGLSLAVLLIHFSAGLKNYWHWTIQFAAARRTPPRGEMLAIYQGKILILWLAIFAGGVILLWIGRRGNRAMALVGSLLMSAPFAWPAIYLLRDQDASERADRLIAVWPALLIVAFVVAIATIKRRAGIALPLPFILIAAINGNFMSQQLWGSTYAVWPLFMILFASTIVGLTSLLKSSPSWMTVPLTVVVAASLLIAGGFYVRAHERLDYANLSDGELTRSTLPQLKGLSVRGPWLTDFAELVRYSEKNIPRDDALLLIPGEDLFYYTTGRRPRFPVLLFDHTTNPYSPEEIVQLCRDQNVRWVIIKQDLQLEEDPVENRDRLIELLEKDFEQVETLNNYDIYRRNDPGKVDADDDEP